MIVAVIVLAWLLINTLATLFIICIDEGTPVKVSDWVGVGLSCVLSPLTILFIIQPIIAWINKLKRKKR
jgi:hypothetical protein